MTHTATQLPHSARLVHITPNAEDLIAYMARVSNPSNQSNTETSAKLIKYLINHQHWSPFEMVNMCVEINTTRSIAAQILRHRSFSFQEFSQRYADTNLLGDAKPFELRYQDVKNRQASIRDINGELGNYFSAAIENCFANAQAVYDEMISKGVAKECARNILPLCSPTRMYMNGSIRSWLHYCDLRTGHGTQKEHAMIAGQIQDILLEQLPSVCRAMWPEEI